MAIASGWLKTSNDTKFVAAFMIGARQFIFAGTFDTSVAQSIDVTNATLNYSREDILNGTTTFTASIGTNPVTLNFTVTSPDSIMISGTLDRATSAVYTPTGRGTWTAN
ncbi:hypothetical protein B0H14DRAFT_2711237 [Mycena olivaceomarginata]|nr:hypothetical protein B0H14DRAFT_2711237 [Mycena olivaceomarginata]